MGKDKLRRFAEIDTFSNVFQLEAGKPLKGKWASDFFKKDKPLVFKLACGKCEYTLIFVQFFP